jgi:hypothetical protein
MCAARSKPRTVEQIAAAIEQQAQELGVVMTPHEKAIARAERLAARVDNAFAGLKANGTFVKFNRDYKNYRISLAAHGKSAKPYFAVIEQLRRLVIKNLATNPQGLSPAVLAEQIRREFAWYK